MTTSLLDRLVRFNTFSSPHDEMVSGTGHIRAVYGDPDRPLVSLIVEVSRVDTGAKLRVGDLLNVGTEVVSLDLNPGARGILIDDASPQLSVRGSSVCRLAGLRTLGDLADRTPGELLRTKNLGRGVLNEIVAMLAANGLRLRGDS